MTLIRLVIICIAKPFKKALIIITFIGVASMTVTCVIGGWRFPGKSVVAYRDYCEPNYRGRA
jgi:hypothetical protein